MFRCRFSLWFKVGFCVLLGLFLVLPRSVMAEGEKGEVSGAVEVEAQSYKRDFDDPATDSEDASDIALATVEVGIDAELNPSVQGHVLLLWEEGETGDINDFMDEGTITISNEEKCPYYLTAGKMYLPFGVFESAFISDPMTLELGEINDTAVQLGYRKGNADISFGFFNGDVDKPGKDDKVNCYFANASFEYAQDPYSLGFVVSYLSNMADTDGLEGAVDSAATMTDEVQGLGVSLNANMGTWFLTAEYLAAMDDFEANLFTGVAKTIKPETYNVEFGWDTGRNATVALKYEQSDDMEINDDFDLGESRYGICLAYELYDDVVLGFEYLHEKYDNVNLNKGESDAITAQLAIGF